MFEFNFLNDLPKIPVLFLYAEIHYKILKFPSRLFHRWPEILADVPRRIEPGKKIPILLMVKDAHRFPVQLEKVWVKIRFNKNEIHDFDLITKPSGLDSSWWHRIIKIDPPGTGNFLIDVYFQVRKKREQKIFKNDNYRRSSHASLKVTVAENELPHFPGQYSGDLHCHSNYTSDQVEFGPPAPAIREAAISSGLSFVAVTDHSYDLDDRPENYLKNDPDLRKWKHFHQEVTELNQNQTDSPFFLIPGEEVSVANRLGRNVHFIVLNADEFYPGSGDSAEKWFRTRAAWSLEHLLADLPPQALAIIPHPFISVPLLEYIFLRRGNIKKSDIQNDRIEGLQILNGVRNPAFYRGLENWKRELLNGKRFFIYAGNDSHGNFNRYRQIKLPHWSLLEKEEYIFATVKTVLCLNEPFCYNAIITALREGRCYITDGPAIQFFARDKFGETHGMGSVLNSDSCQLNLSVRSTPEFGEITEIKIYRGSLQQNREFIQEAISNRDKTIFKLTITCRAQEAGYYRAAVTTRTGNKTFKAFSNPIWVKKNFDRS